MSTTGKNLERLPRTIEWVGELDGFVRMIDQTKLPDRLQLIECHDVDTVWEAIRSLRVRGAPAIGIAAAMGAVLGVRSYPGDDARGLLQRLDGVCEKLAAARPTAANLFGALDRMKRCAARFADDYVEQVKRALWLEAKTIHDEEAAMCRAIGRFGEPLIASGCRVLTHCNAGALATAELGTALAPIYLAHKQGRRVHIFVTETRPLLQGSRLTAWELQQAGIDVTLLCDGMAGALMSETGVDLVITGADRIAANGDVANKIGTYTLAVLAARHKVPFYVAAPSSTFDLNVPDGSAIPIEKRDADEIRRGFGRLTAPADVDCYTPAFDVTPAELVRGIITDRGLIEPINRETVAAVLEMQTAAVASCQDSRCPTE